jgi:bifunctional non-homologous end joining protein LigD
MSARRTVRGLELPREPGWRYELKWDGMRTLVSIDGNLVKVHSRHGTDFSGAFPELVPLANVLAGRSATLDGELVVIADGRPSFEHLSRRLIGARHHAGYHARHLPAALLVFDVLALDGTSTCAMPWSERRRLLIGMRLDDRPGAWRVNPAHDDGPALLDANRAMGLEGVVAKRCASRYLSGRRSRSWLKVKNIKSGWFDLVAWQPPSGKRPGGPVVADNGRVVALAFPALTAPERDKLAGVLELGNRDERDRIHVPVGSAEVRIDYLERNGRGQLREAVARAVRASL